MTPTWFRVPEWVWSVNDEASGKKARAWVYLLGSWHAGNDPGIREVMRATGYGGGMTTALVRDVARWARDAGARLPEQYIDSAGTVPNAGKPRATPNPATVDASAGTVDRFCGNDSRARVPYETRRDKTRVEPDTENAPAPAVALTPTPEQSHDDQPTRAPSPESRPDANRPTDGGGGPVHAGGADDASRPANEDGVPVEQAPRGTGPAVTRERGVPADLHAAMLRCIEEVRQTTVNPERTATDRKSLASLWKAIGKPDAATFEEEFRAVARWARESEDKAAAGDIRGIGWKDNAGTDRHRDIATLCRQEKWGFRLELARRWVAYMGIKPAGAPDVDWSESDAARLLAQKRISGGSEIVHREDRMKFLARRTLNQIGGVSAWAGRPVSAEWVSAWRKEWPASVEAWERKQQQEGAAK